MNSVSLSARTDVTMTSDRLRSMAAVVLGLNITAQVIALGCNQDLLRPVAAGLNFATAIAVLLLLPPSVRFWRFILVPMLLLLTALFWAILPDLANIAGLGSGNPLSLPERAAPDLTLPGSVGYLGTMAVLLAGAVIGYRRDLVTRSFDSLLVGAAVIAVTGLVLRQIDPEHVWGIGKGLHEQRFTGTMVNANAAACVFAVLTILGAARALVYGATPYTQRSPSYGFRQGCYLFLSALSAFCCLITASRTGFALLLAALVALAAQILWNRRSMMTSNGYLLVGLVLLGLVTAPMLLADRLSFLLADAEDRGAIFTHYWVLAQEQPLFGFGLQSFSAMNLAHLRSPQEAFEYGYINGAHNQVLQLLLAGGWPFLALQCLAIFGIVVAVVTSGPRREVNLYRTSIWLSLALILGCSLVDIALTVPAVLTLAASLLGLLWGRGLRDRERN